VELRPRPQDPLQLAERRLLERGRGARGVVRQDVACLPGAGESERAALDAEKERPGSRSGARRFGGPASQARDGPAP